MMVEEYSDSHGDVDSGRLDPFERGWDGLVLAQVQTNMEDLISYLYT